MQSNKDMPYGFWNMDKEALPGETRELLSIHARLLETPEKLKKLGYLPNLETDTLIDIFERAETKWPNNEWLGTFTGSDYDWATVRGTLNTSRELSQAVRARNLCPEQTFEDKPWRFMGILGHNCVEWLITEYANIYQGITCVPMYESLNKEQLWYIFAQSEMTTITISPIYFDKFIAVKRDDQEGKAKNFKYIIYFDKHGQPSKEQIEAAEAAGLELIALNDLVREGQQIIKENKAEYPKPTQDTHVLLSYTSGSTGIPKAVKVTHKMLVSNCYEFAVQYVSINYSEDDSFLMFSPLAHISSQCCTYYSLLYCYKIGFFSGNRPNLINELQILKPTHFGGVPRLISMIYFKMQDKIKELKGPARWMIEKAINQKISNLRNGEGFTHRILDPIIMRKFKQVLGGRIKFIGTASAPCEPYMLDFLKACFCCPIMQGYAMTETCGSGCWSSMDKQDSVTVGGPQILTRIKLRDLPELGYRITDNPPRGEIMI